MVVRTQTMKKEKVCHLKPKESSWNSLTISCNRFLFRPVSLPGHKSFWVSSVPVCENCLFFLCSASHLSWPKAYKPAGLSPLSFPFLCLMLLGCASSHIAPSPHSHHYVPHPVGWGKQCAVWIYSGFSQSPVTAFIGKWLFQLLIVMLMLCLAWNMKSL